jgi:hypothetical protein
MSSSKKVYKKRAVAKKKTTEVDQPVVSQEDPPVVDSILETPTPEPKKGPKKTTAPFLEPQVVTVDQKDYLAVFDQNGRAYDKEAHLLCGHYSIRWKNRSIINTGRHGIWAVLPKDHPEFQGKVFVNRDDSPNENYYTYEDLVLCVSRKETTLSKRAQVRDTAKRRLESSKEQVREDVRRIARETQPSKAGLIQPIG